MSEVTGKKVIPGSGAGVGSSESALSSGSLDGRSVQKSTPSLPNASPPNLPPRSLSNASEYAVQVAPALPSKLPKDLPPTHAPTNEFEGYSHPDMIAGQVGPELVDLVGAYVTSEEVPPPPTLESYTRVDILDQMRRAIRPFSSGPMTEVEIGVLEWYANNGTAEDVKKILPLIEVHLRNAIPNELEIVEKLSNILQALCRKGAFPDQKSKKEIFELVKRASGYLTIDNARITNAFSNILEELFRPHNPHSPGFNIAEWGSNTLKIINEGRRACVLLDLAIAKLINMYEGYVGNLDPYQKFLFIGPCLQMAFEQGDKIDPKIFIEFFQSLKASLQPKEKLTPDQAENLVGMVSQLLLAAGKPHQHPEIAVILSEIAAELNMKYPAFGERLQECGILAASHFSVSNHQDADRIFEMAAQCNGKLHYAIKNVLKLNGTDDRVTKYLIAQTRLRFKEPAIVFKIIGDPFLRAAQGGIGHETNRDILFGGLRYILDDDKHPCSEIVKIEILQTLAKAYPSYVRAHSVREAKKLLPIRQVFQDQMSKILANQKAIISSKDSQLKTQLYTFISQNFESTLREALPPDQVEALSVFMKGLQPNLKNPKGK